MDTPAGFLSVREWIDAQGEVPGTEFISLIPSVAVVETPPLVIGHPVSGRFTRHYNRNTNEAFVAALPGGRIFGEYTNILLTPDNYVLADVSREFGAEGGRRPADFSVFHQRLRMPPIKKIKGKAAVISTCGSNNFHHWNFDVLPRLHLLKKAGLLEQMDHLVIHYRELPFQLAGLERLGIDRRKILNSRGEGSFFLEPDILYIPSLPEDLGTISPWVADFLRDTFLPGETIPAGTPEKLFISRRNAPSRRIINEPEVMREILARGYAEFVPEDHTMQETARYFAAARSLVSVHGSGFSNLPFVGADARVLDIMAPYHQDPYYWMICNNRKARYVALFSEGAHPPDDFDLVKHKVDDDLHIDLEKLKKALDLV
jgi:capsular polysaccharide biosynthesis protein